MGHAKTFLFTDLENSTQLWEQYPAEMQSVLAGHDDILKLTITNANGTIVKSTGDGVHAIFDSVQDALNAALEGHG